MTMANECNNLRTLYQETVVPLNKELSRLRIKMWKDLLVVAAGCAGALALLHFMLKRYDPDESLSHGEVMA